MSAAPDYFKTEAEAEDAGHHRDCDGWRMHSVEAVRTEYGTFKPSCPICGVLPVVGSAGSQQTAISRGAGHSESVRCAGECNDWTE